MKNPIVYSGLAIMLVVGLLAGSFFGNAAPVSAQDQAAAVNSISVQGTSSIVTAPTVAYLTIGVETFNKDASIAQSENATKMDAVYKALAAIGITKTNIKTVSYTINPRYSYANDTSTLVGYDVSNLVQVTILDMTKVSKALDVTVKQGVNKSNSIYFGITDAEREALYTQALEKAVKNAAAKAQALAKAAGVTIGKPSQIIENSSWNVYPIYSPVYDKMLAEGSSVSTPISGGELKVEASIGVVYNY
jgi:uncharacterized protein